MYNEREVYHLNIVAMAAAGRRDNDIDLLLWLQRQVTKVFEQ